MRITCYNGTKANWERKALCESFMDKITELKEDEQDTALWEILSALQGSVFYTAKGLSFTYRIKGGEMFVSRKEKSITQATVLIAFHKALELRDEATGPKKLGTFGASYLYPIFERIGVIRHSSSKQQIDTNQQYNTQTKPAD